MYLIHRLVLTCLRFSIMFQAHHIPGKNNVLADHLSRLQTAKFRQLEGQLQNLNPFQKSLKQLMETSLAPSTKVTCKRAWSLYSKFAHDHSLNPDLPVSMPNLALFISFLVRKPYKPATILSYIYRERERERERDQ